MKWILIITISFIIYYLRYKRFINPYKLIMIFGKKGSGKSSYLAKLAKKNLKKGKLVYTNMDDLMLPGIRKFDINDLGDFIPEKDSIILIDEAGIVYDNRNFKKFKESQRDFYKYQRHYKCTVYLASQTYDVDKKLRDLVDSMILVQNIGIVYTLLRPIKKSITLTEATSDSESRIAENLKFCWPFSWRIFKLTKYSQLFESFKTPDLPPLKYYSDQKNVEHDYVKVTDNKSREE